MREVVSYDNSFQVSKPRYPISPALAKNIRSNILRPANGTLVNMSTKDAMATTAVTAIEAMRIFLILGVMFCFQQRIFDGAA
jgi:hypothetical protein